MHWTLDDLYAIDSDVYDVLIEELKKDQTHPEG